jgi:hypothetical protein
MDQKQSRPNIDLDVRYYIYATFAQTSHPPTSQEIANHFKRSNAEIEASLERLASAHHIALAPGSYSIWMAHPFSGLPTNFIAEVGGKEFWGN